MVVADPDQIDRILFNLLSNAHKYGLPSVLVDAKRVGDVIELSVTDHGPGVDAALRERLFGRFEQGDYGPTRRSSGVGLGLHIVGELASLNGGDVRCDDSVTGASLIVSLPAS